MPDKEIAGQKPVPLTIWEAEKKARANAAHGPGNVKGGKGVGYYLPDNDEGASKVGKTGRIWRTRRRRDGKVSGRGRFFVVLFP